MPPGVAATPPGPAGPWGPPGPSYAEQTRPLPATLGQQPDDRGFLGGALADGPDDPDGGPDEQQSTTTAAGLPRWVWPAVAGLALVLGLTGGAVAGGLVSADGDASSISIERRTAQPLPSDNSSIASVAETVLPSTVQILAGSAGAGGGATGSGFVYDEQGHVITNNHVVADAAEKGQDIRIVDQDGNRSPAKVVGRSTVYDLAVLESEGARSMEPAAVGSADQMRVGETVVAFGSPLGLSSTVTSGIISAVNRPVTTGESQSDNSYINAVQTDAAINPGNSGGPLVNLQGQVVGVNSAIASLGSAISSDQGGNIGVGFAIPIEQVEVTAAQILKTGKAQYPVIGANVSGLPTLDGARIAEVDRGSPAADADLEVGDVIRRVDDSPVTSSADLVVAIRSHVPGEEVTLSVERSGRDFSVSVRLDAKTE